MARALSSRYGWADRTVDAGFRRIRSGEVLVLSLGAGGALWVTRDQRERLTAPLVATKSTVGAGDSMVAGIVHALAQGRPLSEAMRFGVAAGSAAVMQPGTALCRLDDVERLFPQIERIACNHERGSTEPVRGARSRYASELPTATRSYAGSSPRVVRRVGVQSVHDSS